MDAGNSTNSTNNASDVWLFILFVIVCFLIFSLGGLGVAFAFLTLGIVRGFKLSDRVILWSFSVAVLASGGLHFLYEWRPIFLYEHPKYVALVTYEAITVKAFTELKNLWLVSFNTDLRWIGIHSIIFVGMLLLVQMLHDYVNPIRAERKRQNQTKQDNDKAAVKPLLNNADKKSAVAKGEGTALGNDAVTGKVVTLSDKHANSHTLIAGTTNSGKTVSVLNLVESFIDRGLPVLYVDGKGDRELGERICAYASKKGVAGRLFSMTGDSATYNPLYTGSFTSKKDRIVEVRDWTEPHYKTLAEGYLQMVFSVLEKLGEEANFLDVAEYMRFDTLRDLIRTKVRAGDITKEQGTELNELMDEQKGAVDNIESLAAEIRNLARSEIGHLFEYDKVENIVLKESLKRGEVVYMGLTPLSFPALAATLGRIIVNDLKASIDPSHFSKMLVVFDEFGVFAGDQVLNVINQGRSAGVHAVLTVQSVSDIGRNINKNSQAFIEQVFSNCNNYIIHRVNSAVNAEALSAIIGTTYSQQITTRVTDGVGFSGEGSYRSTREFTYHPDQLKSLKTGQAVFLNRNNGFHSKVNMRQGSV